MVAGSIPVTHPTHDPQFSQQFGVFPVHQIALVAVAPFGRSLAFLPLLLVVLTSAAGAQEGASSPRLAALRFAIQHGLNIPTSDVIVAREPNAGMAHAQPSKETASKLGLDAENIAKAIGPIARTGSATDLLDCSKLPCVPRTRDAVVALTDLAQRGSVLIQVFSPAPQGRSDVRVVISQVIVYVQNTEAGWVGVRTQKAPQNDILIKR